MVVARNIWTGMISIKPSKRTSKRSAIVGCALGLPPMRNTTERKTDSFGTTTNKEVFDE